MIGCPSYHHVFPGDRSYLVVSKEKCSSDFYPSPSYSAFQPLTSSTPRAFQVNAIDPFTLIMSSLKMVGGIPQISGLHISLRFRELLSWCFCQTSCGSELVRGEVGCFNTLNERDL